MTLEGVDYSFGRPGGAALAAAGKAFAIRYITGSGKALLAPEVDNLHAHGVAIGLVFETTKQRPLGGRAAGIADAKAALAAATKLGIPVNRPIYFAVDWQATSAQYPTILAYLVGAGTVLGLPRVGCYGHAALMDYLAAHGIAWLWQTYAWSGGRVSTKAHVIQYHNGQTIGGAAVDLCRALRADFGQWPAPTAGPTRWRVSITGPTKLFSRVGGTVLGGVSKASYTCTRVKAAGLWWYRIVAGKRTGQAFKPNRHCSAVRIP